MKISKVGRGHLNTIWKIQGSRDMSIPELSLYTGSRVVSSFKLLNQERKKTNKKRKKLPNANDCYELNECNLPIGEKL